MKPASWVLGASRKVGLTSRVESIAPYLFKGALEPMVDVQNLARLTSVAATDASYQGKLLKFTNQQIIDFK